MNGQKTGGRISRANKVLLFVKAYGLYNRRNRGRKEEKGKKRKERTERQERNEKVKVVKGHTKRMESKKSRRDYK